MNAQEERDQKALAVVEEMLSKDLFSKWLGIEVLEIKEGYSKLQMKIREEMINGFDIAHGLV